MRMIGARMFLFQRTFPRPKTLDRDAPSLTQDHAMAEKILVVDDDIDSLKLIGLMLQRSGYEVSAASAGAQALAKASSDRPDLIILDIMMPKMNGLDAARAIAADSKTAKIPILLLSGVGDLDKQLDALEELNVEYLTKPFKQRELADFVNSMLDPNLHGELERHRRHQIGKLRMMVEIMHKAH